MPPKGRQSRRWNTTRYGIPESEDEGTLDSGPSELGELFHDDVWGTAKSLDSLMHHQDYKKWLRHNKITEKDVNVVEARLKVYQDLRELDPSGFRRLLEEPKVALTVPCGGVMLTAEYLLNTVLTSVLLCVLLLTHSKAAEYIVTLLLLCNAWCWVQGTSLFGCWAGLWWEDTTWGHRASWRSCLASNIVEVLYCLVTAGMGALVSIGLRFQGGGGQGLGERLLNLRLIKEVEDQVELPDTPPGSPSPKASPASRARVSPRRRRL